MRRQLKREKQMRVSSRRQDGFTLMELLAAVTLMVILGTMLFAVFENSSGVIREASGRQALFLETKLFMDHVERELSGAYIEKSSSGAPSSRRMRPFLIKEDGHHFALVTAAKLRDMRMYIDSQPNPGFGAEANLGRIGYFLKDNIIYRYEYYTLYDDGNEQVEIDRATPFIYNVVAFNVEVFDNGRFRTMDWDSRSKGCLPRAVRITLQLTDDRHLSQYLDMNNDTGGDGYVDSIEAGDTIGVAFQHVAYLGGRS